MSTIPKPLFIVLTFVFLLSGCGGSGSSSGGAVTSTNNDVAAEVVVSPTSVSVTGSGVKGPLAGAEVIVYQVDLSANDLRGSVLGTGTTGTDAAITGLSIPSNTAGLVLLEFNVNSNTVDITSGVAPSFEQLNTIVDASRILAGDSIYASILTTMAIELAANNADTGSPYSGDGNGTISVEEFELALDVAQSQVKVTLGFGMNLDIDIYTVPPLLTDDIDSSSEQEDVVAYRQANEVVAAIVNQTTEASSADDSAQGILQALAEDLSDGDIDGEGLNGTINELDALDEDIDVTLASTDLTTLDVPGTDTPIADIEQIIASETQTTGADVDTANLENGTLDIDVEEIALVSDIDSDGVIDTEDTTPTGEVFTDGGDSANDGGDSGQSGSSNTDGSGSTGGSVLIVGVVDEEVVENTIDAGLNYNPRTAGEDIEAVNNSSLVFRLAGDQTVIEGEQLVNPANTLAGGRITYSSSNNGIASVDINGLVSTWRAGTTTITATSNRGFDLSYELTVSEASTIKLEAWIGESNTELWITRAIDGLSIASSSTADCDFTSVLSCQNGAQNDASEGVVVDSTLTAQQDAFYFMSDGSVSGNTEIGTDRWSDRETPALTVFNGQMWLIGGGDIGKSSSEADVWSTRDGGSWVEVSSDAGFPARRNHAAAAFNGRLWVVGGFDGSSPLNDVWSSADGVTWEQVTNAAPFSARKGLSLVVYNDLLWLIGGKQKGDVWNTADGENWTQISADALPSSGYNEAFVFNNELMFVNSAETSDRVWTSTDGINWSVREDARPPSVTWGSYAVHDNKIWVMAGAFGGMQDRVWVSSNGDDYYEVSQTEDRGFRARYSASAISFNNRLWLMGGNASVGSINDVVSSTDGATWMYHNFGSQLEGRSLQKMAALNGRLYVLGGTSPTGQSTIWSSLDGLNWDEESANAEFGERANHQAFNFNNKLWVVGGDTFYTGTAFSDIWSSEDGKNWTQEQSEAAFGPRTYLRIVEWNGELWMTGGLDNDRQLYADVWRSADGINWTRVTANAGFPARRGHGMAVLNNQLWVFGGIDTASQGLNDVWVSSDGENWTQKDVSSPFTAGFADKSIAHAGRLIILTNSEELWTSTNGITWTNNGRSDTLPGDAYGSSMAVWGNYVWLRASGWSRFRGNYDNAMHRSTDGLNWRRGIGRTVELE